MTIRSMKLPNRPEHRSVALDLLLFGSFVSWEILTVNRHDHVLL